MAPLQWAGHSHGLALDFTTWRQVRYTVAWLKYHDLQCLVSGTSPTTAIDWLETYEIALKTIIFDA